MSRLKFGVLLCLPLLLLMAASTVTAATLYVNCGGKSGLSSIGGALKALQYSEGHGPSTINVSGACHENVVIQSIDRLTLNAIQGASINDVSGGNLAAVTIDDSRDVAVNGFSINGGAGGADAVDCQTGSVCRLNGNTIQGAANGYGIGVYFSQLFLDGGTLQNNFNGLAVFNGSSARATNVAILNNSNGIEIRTHSFVNTSATITANSSAGVFVHEGGTLGCAGCQITGNVGIGVVLKRNSSARFFGPYAVTGNPGGGIQLNEESSAYFAPGTVTGNTGAGIMDVYCGTSSTTARFATTNISGGTTNCVEPSP